MNWIADCLKEIKNITNLFGAISSYKEVVEKLSGTYRSNVMSLTEYVESIKQDHEKNNFIKSAIQLNANFPGFRKNYIQHFFDKLLQELESISRPYDGWSPYYNKEMLIKPFNFPLGLKKDGNKLLIGFEFRKDDYKGCIFIGVLKSNKDINLNEIINDYNLSSYKPIKIKEGKKKIEESKWWVVLEEIENKDFLSFLADRTEEEALEFFVIKFKTLLENNVELCNKTNTANDENDKPISENS